MSPQQLPFVTGVVQKIIDDLGGEMILEPTYKQVGEMFLNGKRKLFSLSNFGVNSSVSHDIAKDKSYSAYFLSKAGVPQPQGDFFFRGDFFHYGKEKGKDHALQYAETLEYPIVVKPNESSQGKALSLVENEEELEAAIEEVFTIDHIAIVQEYIPGNDYRVVMLDGKVLAAYQRLPLAVIGNGVDTITQLLDKTFKDLDESARKVVAGTEEQVLDYLKQKKIGLDTVLPDHEELFVLPNANLSMGGDAIDVTEHIHEDYIELCQKACDAVNLRLCGVDILAEDITSPLSSKDRILEVNSKPSVRHFSYFANEGVIEGLYLAIIKALFEIEQQR